MSYVEEQLDNEIMKIKENVKAKDTVIEQLKSENERLRSQLEYSEQEECELDEVLANMTPLEFANVIVDAFTDVKFLSEVAEHLRIYCDHNRRYN